MLDLENAANPDTDRREAIGDWKSLAIVDVDTTEEVEMLASNLADCGIKPMNALAEQARLLRGLQILNPWSSKLKPPP